MSDDHENAHTPNEPNHPPTNSCRMCLSFTSPCPSPSNHLSSVMCQVGAGQSRGRPSPGHCEPYIANQVICHCVSHSFRHAIHIHVVVIVRRRSIPTLTSTCVGWPGPRPSLHGDMRAHSPESRSFICMHHSFGYMLCRFSIAI